jgi:type IV pilus assembly protein PilE
MLKAIKLNKQGMTLIELSVTVLIIAILAALAVPTYRGIIERTRITNQLVVLKALQDATIRYYAENDDFPSSFKTLSVGAPEGYEVSDLTLTQNDDDGNSRVITLNTTSNSEALSMAFTRKGAADWTLTFEFKKAAVPGSSSYRMVWGGQYFVINTSDSGRKEILQRAAQSAGWKDEGNRYRIN